MHMYEAIIWSIPEAIIWSIDISTDATEELRSIIKVELILLGISVSLNYLQANTKSYCLYWSQTVATDLSLMFYCQ